jgi:predicted MFS family arabinose efflux permease
VSQAIIAVTVPHERRGLAMGVTQNFGSNLFGNFFAPVLLVWFATRLGWHNAFFIAAVPGLIMAFLMWRFIDEPKTASHAQHPDLLSHVRDIFSRRNMVICAIMSVLLVSYLVVCWAFMPLFLTSVRGFSPDTMGWLMGSLGISATAGSFVISYISDRIGRKPVMIVCCFLGLVLPIGAMYFLGSPWLLAAIFVIGWSLTSTFPLFMATVPSESVPHSYVATAMALVMGLGEVLGGVFSPTVAGWAADRTGLSAPLWIMFGLAGVSGLLALFLRETAPAALNRK